MKGDHSVHRPDSSDVRQLCRLPAIARAGHILFMDNIDELLQRNKVFATTDLKDRVPAIPFIPTMQVYVVTCIDPRVDPAAILGLELGDAIVERNVGGRVTPAVIQDVAWISYLHESQDARRRLVRARDHPPHRLRVRLLRRPGTAPRVRPARLRRADPGRVSGPSPGGDGQVDVERLPANPRSRPASRSPATATTSGQASSQPVERSASHLRSRQKI